MLHPAYKLEYFKSAGWENSWIKVSEELVRTEFDQCYASLPITDKSDDRNKDGDACESDDTEKSLEPVCFFYHPQRNTYCL